MCQYTQYTVWSLETALWRALQLELEQSAQPRGTAAVFLDCISLQYICYTIPDETRRAQSHNNAHKFINAVMHTSNLATSRYTAGSGTVARQDCTVQALDADELSQPLARILVRFQR